ncbi:hypothetical protein PMZ80_010117 [Knufia obscura]|uniref:DUF6590 domain-containing protein n=1 Tax=Knufia obscura TaxID=1635080 RepID=A0ABR0RA73_9EURO|nr:hypothetical protein PMZ80_010117 [Knufia obscura]
MLRFEGERAPWPNPEASCVTSIELCPLNKKLRFWKVQGPALAAYNTIRPKIKQCLTDRGNDLYQGLRESSLPHTIDCYMVGKNKISARPKVVISCDKRLFCENVKAIILQATWWAEFRQEYPAFGGFLSLQCAPRRMAKPGSGIGPLVYTASETTSFCGAPIFFITDTLQPQDGCKSLQATLGNVVYLDGQPFGLAVSHPFARDEHVEHSGSDSESSDPWCYADDSDGESFSGSESTCSLDSDTKSLHGKGSNQIANSTKILQGTPQLLGRVNVQSDGTPSDGLDWAIFPIDSTLASDIDKCHHQVAGTYKSLDGAPVDVKQPEQIAFLNEDAISVFTTGHGRGLVKGTLSAGMSLVCLRGSHDYLSLHNLTMTEEIKAGDCGGWVFDERGNWYGHIVAGFPGTNTAYVAPASRIVQDIQQKSGATVISLAPNEEDIDPSRYHAPLLASLQLKSVPRVISKPAETNKQESMISGRSEPRRSGREKMIQMLSDATAALAVDRSNYSDTLTELARFANQLEELCGEELTNLHIRDEEHTSELDATLLSTIPVAQYLSTIPVAQYPLRSMTPARSDVASRSSIPGRLYARSTASLSVVSEATTVSSNALALAELRNHVDGLDGASETEASEDERGVHTPNSETSTNNSAGLPLRSSNSSEAMRALGKVEGRKLRPSAGDATVIQAGRGRAAQAAQQNAGLDASKGPRALLLDSSFLEATITQLDSRTLGGSQTIGDITSQPQSPPRSKLDPRTISASATVPTYVSYEPRVTTQLEPLAVWDMSHPLLPAERQHVGPKAVFSRLPPRLQDQLSAEYKLHVGQHNIDRVFRRGSLIAVLWHENSGFSQRGKASYAQATVAPRSRFVISEQANGEHIYSHIRRFVIVVQRSGYSVGIPVTTYANTGLSKKRMDTSELHAHAIIYSKDKKPETMPGEREFTKSPICVKMSNEQETLSSSSRLYYAKPQSIDHNIKVKHLGHVIDADLPQLLRSFRMEITPEPIMGKAQKI